MSDKSTLTPPEQRIEEIRAIRRRLFGVAGTDLTKLRDIGNRVPQGFRVLDNVRAVVPLSVQLAQNANSKAS